MANDSWTTEEPFVTVDDSISRLTNMKPYKATEDKKGHDAFVHFRVPKNLMRAITKIKEHGPYETNSDVWRDAAWLGLQVLQLRYKEDPTWTAYAQTVAIGNEAEWEARLHEEEKRFVDSVARLCNNNKRDKAIEYLSARLTIIDADRKDILSAELKSHGLAALLDEVTP